MLRRVIAPRQHLEHFVASSACSFSTRILHPVRPRWNAVASLNPQYSTSQAALREEKEEPPTRKPLSLPTHLSTKQHPPEYLASLLIPFLDRHAVSTKSALIDLQSRPSTQIHQILKNPRDVRRVASYLASSNMPTKCLRLLSVAVAYGCCLNAPAFENVCWNLADTGRWSVLLETYRLSKDVLVTPSLRLLNWKLRANCELENFETLELILSEYEQAGVNPNRLTWHLMLTGYIRNRNLAGARECLRMMCDAGFPQDATTHAVVASNYRHLGIDFKVKELVLSVLHSLPYTVSITVVNQLLQSHADFDDEVGFRQLLSLFNPTDISPLQTLLGPLGDIAGQTSPALDPIHSLCPDTITYLIAIRFCIARSNFSAAEKIFQLLEQKQVTYTPRILTTWLDLQFSTNRSNHAVSVAAQLLSKTGLQDLFEKLPSDGYTTNSIINWEFTKFEVEPHIDIFNSLLRGLLFAHGMQNVAIIFNMMKRTGIEPDARTLKILLSHLLDAERVNLAVAVRTLRQLSPVFRPTLRQLHMLVFSHIRNKKRRLLFERGTTGKEEKRRLFSRRREESDADSSNSVAGLNLGRSFGRPNLIRSIVQSLDFRGIQSDSRMLGARIRYEAVIKNDTAAAVEVYTEMLSRGISPSKYHISALMEGFSRCGEVDTALKVMQSAESHEIKPNVVMYTILIYGYGTQRRTKTAMRIFQRMISNGIRPDVRSILALCKAVLLARQPALARKLLITVWTYVQTFPPDYAHLSLKELLQHFRQLDTSSPSWVSRSFTRADRIRLSQQLTNIAMEHKRCFGLQGQLLSNSRKSKVAARASLFTSRK